MAEGKWQDPVKAGRRDRPASVAMTAGVFASMGALVAYAAFLGARTDLRFNPLFWLAALPVMVWIGALGNVAGWATRSLR